MLKEYLIQYVNIYDLYFKLLTYLINNLLSGKLAYFTIIIRI